MKDFKPYKNSFSSSLSDHALPPFLGAAQPIFKLYGKADNVRPISTTFAARKTLKRKTTRRSIPCWANAVPTGQRSISRIDWPIRYRTRTALFSFKYFSTTVLTDNEVGVLLA